MRKYRFGRLSPLEDHVIPGPAAFSLGETDTRIPRARNKARTNRFWKYLGASKRCVYSVVPSCSTILQLLWESRGCCEASAVVLLDRERSTGLTGMLLTGPRLAGMCRHLCTDYTAFVRFICEGYWRMGLVVAVVRRAQEHKNTGI